MQGEITCDYAQYGWVPAMVAAAEGTVTDTRFEDMVTVCFSLPIEKKGALQAELTERSAGRLTVNEIGVGYEPRPIK
jgi:putative IMPACT (imprinted ancient) family translation regulator